jgi:hypothetical protein
MELEFGLLLIVDMAWGGLVPYCVSIAESNIFYQIPIDEGLNLDVVEIVLLLSEGVAFRYTFFSREISGGEDRVDVSGSMDSIGCYRNYETGMISLKHTEFPSRGFGVVDVV